MGMEGLANVLGAYGQYSGAQFTPEQQASLLSSLGMLGNNALASQQMNPNQYGSLQPVDLSSSSAAGNGAAGLGMGGLNDNMYGQGNVYGSRGGGSMGMQSGRSNGQRPDGDMTGNLPNGLGAMYGHYGGNGNSAGYGGQYGAMPRQQRMGSGGANEVSNQWKLFVGQLPPEVSRCRRLSMYTGIMRGQVVSCICRSGPIPGCLTSYTIPQQPSCVSASKARVDSSVLHYLTARSVHTIAEV